ncbi:MAG: hypothetical protein JNM59_13640 [Hyphomonadaceae bacterium]|nr:hypothetical protein [Hyphomonadaceae bacterium]
MAKNKPKHVSADRPQRRPRAEIDRNYFLGDVFMKTGAATGVALAMIAYYTPFSLEEAMENGMYAYLSVVGGFALIGVGFYLVGRHLRHEATHWDFD